MFLIFCTPLMAAALLKMSTVLYFAVLEGLLVIYIRLNDESSNLEFSKTSHVKNRGLRSHDKHMSAFSLHINIDTAPRQRALSDVP